jgi:carbamoyltransferase
VESVRVGEVDQRERSDGLRILGLNAFHGDSSAAVLEDGRLLAAAEEERYNRIKHWAGLPVEAARACLGGERADHIAISRDPKAKAMEKMLRVLRRPGDWGRLFSRVQNSAAILRVDEALREAGLAGEGTAIHHVEHHRAHLASAFFCSPFAEAAVISIDGFGDFSSVMWGVGKGNRIEVRGGVEFPHSLGLFYTAFTQFLGFPKYGDEYKMMGLAAYGEPSYVDKVRDVVKTEGGQVVLNLDYFHHHTKGVEMTWEGGEPALGAVYSEKLVEAFGAPRAYRSEIEKRHRDLAASVQAVLEENYFALLEHVRQETGQSTVCLAGGVALNCAANGKLFARTGYKDVFVQPAAHDAGTSIGAALWVQHQVLGQPRGYVMREVYSGPEEFGDEEIGRELERAGTRQEKLGEDALADRVSEAIAEGQIVGWFQGRMEFGPRALGHRSILADPRREDVKETLNLRIKYREPFRPFCPSVLREAAGEWFTVDYESPYMVMAYPIREEKRALVPGVVHADGTGRLQTVERDVNPLYWKLIRRFGERTGVPILINTSFNENEPIVRTPGEALDCFLRTEMDMLVLGPYVLRKSENRHVEAGGKTLEGAGSGFRE